MTMTYPANIASLAIDAQPTFCEGGGLAVSGGNAIMPAINHIRSKTVKGYWTQDWHPEGHVSLASTHGRAPFTMAWIKNGQIVAEHEEGGAGPEGAILQMFWPDHGIRNTTEAELHPALDIPPGDLVMKKGVNLHIDSYSCVFENDKVTRPCFGNGRTLPEQLRLDGVDTVVISGIALDVCVRDGALDMKKEGFRVIVLTDATAAITPQGRADTLEQFARAGVETCTLDSLDRLPGFFNEPATHDNALRRFDRGPA